MAEALLGVVAEGVISKALSLATQEISGALGVREDLERLAEQLELIQALLADAGRKSSSSGLVQLWLERLEAAAADADNFLDEFAYEVRRKKMQKGKKEKVRSFFSSSNPLVFRFNMASKIKTINLRMDGIFQESTRIGLRPAEITNYAAVDLKRVPLTDPFIVDSKAVGRDHDVGEIVRQLTCLKDETDLSVIGIVGMAGQGKTTVAKLLLRDHKVMNHFDKKIWTCVSDDFNVDKILNDMLQSLTAKASQLTNREAIVKKLNEELNEKRFLLVLDDVWNEDSGLWDCMNNSLKAIGGSKGGRILVTTRNERVVSVMKGFVYHLGVLSPEASRELFENIAFGNDEAAKTTELGKIGARIVERCGGVPLALKAMGSLMSTKRDEREWQKIEESSMWYASDGVGSAIRLSFDHLPSLSLKQCFAYCSVFPKGLVMERKGLIQLWMAHGLLNPSGGSGMEMEDVGNNYFNILLQRSLLQEAEIDDFGNIITCRMHDLVHDFALKASKGRCWTGEDRQLTDNIKVIHLSVIANKNLRINILEKNFFKLRTLMLFGKISPGDYSVLCKCKYLRVLVVANMQMEELPNSIAKLKHLRNLNISRTSISVLPDFITKLYNLQTLGLPDLPELPKDFGSMVNLRHLHIREASMSYRMHLLMNPSSNYCLIRGIRQLASLRTLSLFVVSEDKGCQIEELSNLKDLEGNIIIGGLQNVANRTDATKANLSEKMNIESLDLCWGSIYRREGLHDEDVLQGLRPHLNLKALKIENFMGKNLPSWMALLRNLVNINLKSLSKCDKLPALGHLPSLKVVEINDMISVKCIGDELYGWTDLASAHSSQTSAVVFPSLRELTFQNMIWLEEWSDAVHPSSVPSVKLFPCLEKLEIKQCQSLIHLPGFLNNIFSLRHLTFSGLNKMIHLPDNLSDLTGLESLQIDFCFSLVSLPDISRLRSLNQLKIAWLLKSTLPRGIEACKSLRTLEIPCTASLMESLLHNFTNLTSLTIQFSKNIDYMPFEPISNSNTDDDIQQHNRFATLQDLTLFGTSELTSLPQHIQHFTALRDLSLHIFSGLKVLPEWLSNFHSLRKLVLRDCKSLMSFPSAEVMQGLTNLYILDIKDCPILKESCEKGSGAEWHKIAHIPKIFII